MFGIFGARQQGALFDQVDDQAMVTAAIGRQLLRQFQFRAAHRQAVLVNTQLRGPLREAAHPMADFHRLCIRWGAPTWPTCLKTVREN